MCGCTPDKEEAWTATSHGTCRRRECIADRYSESTAKGQESRLGQAKSNVPWLAKAHCPGSRAVASLIGFAPIGTRNRMPDRRQ